MTGLARGTADSGLWAPKLCSFHKPWGPAEVVRWSQRPRLWTEVQQGRLVTVQLKTIRITQGQEEKGRLIGLQLPTPGTTVLFRAPLRGVGVSWAHLSRTFAPNPGGSRRPPQGDTTAAAITARTPSRAGSSLLNEALLPRSSEGGQVTATGTEPSVTAGATGRAKCSKDREGTSERASLRKLPGGGHLQARPG